MNCQNSLGRSADRPGFDPLFINRECIYKVCYHFLLALVTVDIFFFLFIGNKAQLHQYAWHACSLQYPYTRMISLFDSPAETTRCSKLFFHQVSEVKTLFKK